MTPKNRTFSGGFGRAAGDGGISKHWPEIPLGEIAVSRGGSVDPQKHPNEIFDLYSIPAYDTGKPEIQPGNAIGSTKKAVQQNDVLLSRIVPHIQRVWVVGEKTEYRQIASSEWIIYRSNRYHPPFLRHALLSQGFHSQFMETVAGVGGSLLRARPTAVAQIKIPLPPLPEQKRIAAILDKADAIRRKRRQALAMADQFLRAVFLEMFGDPVTNPKGWRKEKLGKLCRIRRGASPRPISKFLGGTVPWIKIGDGTSGSDLYIEETKERVTEAGAEKSVYLEPGSLIFANCGVSLGFARILKIGGCIHDGWLAFDQIDQELDKVFLLKALNSITDHFRRIAPDGTQPNLNTGIMKDFQLILPPASLQKEYVDILQKAFSSSSRLHHLESEVDELFGSLTQRAFRGEL